MIYAVDNGWETAIVEAESEADARRTAASLFEERERALPRFGSSHGADPTAWTALVVRPFPLPQIVEFARTRRRDMSANTWKCRCGVDVLIGTTHYCGGIAKTVTRDPMHRVHELEAENQRLRERLVTLRDGIEKLRDDVERLHDLDDEDFDGGWVSQRYVARRLTELLVHGDET